MNERETFEDLERFREWVDEQKYQEEMELQKQIEIDSNSA